MGIQSRFLGTCACEAWRNKSSRGCTGRHPGELELVCSMLMRRCGVGFGALLKKALTTMKRRMFGTQKGKGMQDTRCERGWGRKQ